MHLRHLITLLASVLVFALLRPPVHLVGALQGGWLSEPPTAAGAQTRCPDAGRWLLLYWGGSPAPIQHAAAACPTADRFWTPQGSGWLGFSRASPTGSDNWTVLTGQAAFIYQPPAAVASPPITPAQAGATATATATPSPTPPPPTPSPTPAAMTAGGDQPIGPQARPQAVGLPENVHASPEFLALKDVLAGEIAAYRAQIGDIEVAIAVTDLQTGETISVNGNVLQRTGCTINLFALLASVTEFQAGHADPEPLAGLIRVGIGSSSPPEVTAFLTAIFGSHERGVEQARELMRSWGMKDSLFHHVPYYGDGTQNNLLTALETNLALTKLYRGELFSLEWTEYTLGRLLEIKPGLNYILPGQLPPSATVAHKIGYYWDLDGWVNADAGIVAFADANGRQTAYAITYLSEKAPTEYAGYSFGARLSRIVWDYFVAKYGLAGATL